MPIRTFVCAGSLEPEAIMNTLGKHATERRVCVPRARGAEGTAQSRFAQAHRRGHLRGRPRSRLKGSRSSSPTTAKHPGDDLRPWTGNYLRTRRPMSARTTKKQPVCGRAGRVGVGVLRKRAPRPGGSRAGALSKLDYGTLSGGGLRT